MLFFYLILMDIILNILKALNKTSFSSGFSEIWLIWANPLSSKPFKFITGTLIVINIFLVKPKAVYSDNEVDINPSISIKAPMLYLFFVFIFHSFDPLDKV